VRPIDYDLYSIIELRLTTIIADSAHVFCVFRKSRWKLF